MNKKIAVLLVLVLLGGSALWAIDSEWLGWGFGAMATGGVFAGLGLLFPSDQDIQLIFYGTGALLGFFGLIGIVVGLVSDGRRYAQAVNESPIRNVSFAILPDNKWYLGARYKF